MKNHAFTTVNPFVIFWLGLLTGALIVSLVFLYRFVNSVEYKASTLLKLSPTYSTTSLTPATNFVNPTNLKAFGDGGGPGW